MRNLLFLMMLSVSTTGYSDVLAEVDTACYDANKNSCIEMLAQLEAIEHPTVDERVALWSARVYRAYLDDTIRKPKIAEAVGAWRQIVDEYPTHVGALFLLAASVESDESIELFRKVIELDPSHIIAIDLIVRLLVRTDSSENQQEALDYQQLGNI